MFRILFLIFVMLSTVALAQTPEKNEATKFFEYGKITDNVLKNKLDEFGAKLFSNLQGYIVNYGTDREIAQREKQIQRNYFRCDLDCPKVTIIRGGNDGKPRTIIWLAPPGSDNFVPGIGRVSTLQPFRVEKIGKVSDRFFKDIFHEFFERVKQGEKFNGYIVMHGTEGEIADFEKRIKSLEFFEFYNSDRVIFLRKIGTPAQATISLWLVPQGQEYTDELDNK